MATPIWWYRTIHLGDTGPDVDVIRRKLGLAPGPYDEACNRLVKGMTGYSKVPSLGDSVDAAAAEVIGESAANEVGLVPEWFEKDIDKDTPNGEDVRALRGRLALDSSRNDVTYEVVEAVRRFQSQHVLPTTGVVDAGLARLLG